MLDQDTTAIAYVKKYHSKYNKLEINWLVILKPTTTPACNQDVDQIASMSGTSVSSSRKFKLSEIELKKFSGDIIINESRAKYFVNSFPPTAENYKNVIRD